ncbi:MAG TPA: divalent metal cation transporter [Candidatus Angelobacter sp.]|nr:divalent metal cation transporter [Candidatus Angelobacter sp.]
MNSPRSHSELAGGQQKVLRWPGGQAQTTLGPGGPFRRIIPGMVTGASDVDPALVLTATVAGATYQYSLLWSVLLCVPFLLAVFAVSARIGFETRQGLVDLLRSHYGKTLAFVCAGVIVAINMAMIVADLMAVTDAFSIIMQLPRMFFIAAVAFSVWYILIFRDYRKITHALVLLSLPLFIYVAAAIVAHPDWKQVISYSLFPRIPRGSGYPAAVVAIFGSLLTPYVLVWQTSSRREDAIAGVPGSGRGEHQAGTVVTTVLCYSIMVAAGTVLRTPLGSDMTTRMAASALTPAVGSLGTVLFALGIIGAGMVALPVLVASMCYSVAEAMGWRSGLNENPWEAVRFYVLISFAMFLAAALNFLKINPVTALYWSQILAGALTVPILVFILLISNNRRVMRTTNRWWQNFWIGAATGAIIAAGLIVFWWKIAG